MRVVLLWYLFPLGLQMSHVMSEDVPSPNDISNQLSDTGELDGAQVHFKLYISENERNWIPISVDNSSDYLKSVFYYEAETKFIVHGWLSSEDSITVNYTANEYKAISRGNIVKVDWSRDAAWLLYPLSALQVSYIGRVVANFIDKLLEIQAIDLTKLHLIGHSLGAHVMGNAGSMIKSGKPKRITGLDPAKPGFEGLISEVHRLDCSDGEFVDVIHSAAGAAGYYSAIGHVDFYPNGGSPPQPGCFEMSQPWQLIGCSHARSYMYYIESISNPAGFPAVECDSWSNFKSGACNNNSVVYMGDETPPSARGIYYLKRTVHRLMLRAHEPHQHKLYI